MAVYPGEYRLNFDVEISPQMVDPDSYSVLITKRDKTKKTLPISIVFAAKPLIYVSSLCGLQMFRYTENEIGQIQMSRRLYSVFLVTLILLLLIFNKPVSWIDTRLDLPLNVLTKTFGTLHNVELVCSILISSFCNNTLNLKFFRIFDRVDVHYKTPRSGSRKVKWLSIVLILVPCVEFCFSFILRKFQIRNLPVHLTFFVLSMQGSMIIFIAINLFLKQLMLNFLLELKADTIIGMPEEKAFKALPVIKIIKVI